MRSTFLLVLVALLAPGFLHDLNAQTSFPLIAPNRYQPGSIPGPGVITSTISKGDSILERRTIDPNEEMQVIVQFQSPPLSTLHRQATMERTSGAAYSSGQTQIESDHTRFQADLARLEGGSPGAPSALGVLKAAASRVGGEYRKVFNGVALRSRRWLVDRLRTLPYVKSISPDKQVHTLDSSSNHQIGADSVWANTGATGDGVRVGVLDTGIDYMHPDLGGGIGPGYKVAGGWDFANNDSDPADDEGHGTHVAGIIAANGPSLRGVAPNATLYAIKVLSSEGMGLWSWTMSGLEWAVDPDDNPATDDHLDVVNLSLGGTGDPTDPVSQAIDNATAAGVLCVVAAGNEGSYQSIGSPGCATGALTVGACDHSDVVANFSSRGPTNYLYTIKPDLVAPGVDITSTVLGGSYASWSGTSMATPHAAGAAALLKQLHPDWTPEMLKGAFMGTAKNLGQDLWSQGKGRLDVAKAVHAKVVAFPQTLSFGLDNLTFARWSQTDTISLYNVSDSALSITIDQFAGLPAGVSLTSDASAITVSAHGTAQLAFTLDVNNSIVRIPREQSYGVTGTVTLVSPGDTLGIPWAVVIGPYVELQVTMAEDCSPGDAIFTPLSGGPPVSSYDFTSTGATTWQLRKLLPSGNYEVTLQILCWSKAGVAWLVRDSIRVNPVASLTMSESDALYRVGTALKDENGVELDSTITLTWCTRLYSKRTGVGIQMGVYGPTGVQSQLDRVSPLSSNYVFDYYYTSLFEGPKVYSYAGQVSPVLADHVTDIKAGDLVRRDIEYRFHFNVPSLKPDLHFPFFSSSPGYVFNTFFSALAPPFRQIWYSQGHPLTNFPWNGALFNHQFWFDGSRDTWFDPIANPPLLVTPNQFPGEDAVLRSSLSWALNPVQESRGRKVIYGLGPRHFFGRMDNSVPTLLRVKTPTKVGIDVPFFPREGVFPLFLNQAMDVEPVPTRLRLQDSTGRVIYQSTSLYPNHLDFADESLKMDLPRAGRYTLQLWGSPSYVLSLEGAAIVNLTVDTRLPDRNPPAMTSFNILGPDSEYTDMLLPGDEGRVEFRTSDAETGLRSVSLFYHTDSSRAWMSLPTTNQGDLYRGQLPAFALKDGFVSLRVLATDASGNAMDYRAEPALHVGADFTDSNRPPEKVQLLTPGLDSLLQLYEPGLPTVFSWQSAWDRDGWDTLSYTFHVRGRGLGTAGDRWLRDTTVTLWLMGVVAPDEIYQWWVETTDGHVTVSSDTVTFRASSSVLAVQKQESNLPKEFALGQNYPNPFNPTTTIRYALPQRSHVTLIVFNLLGQEVATLVNGEVEAGYREVQFNAVGLASGVYLYRLQAGSFTQTKKLCVIK
jgi:subtilisin family serine protease